MYMNDILTHSYLLLCHLITHFLTKHSNKQNYQRPQLPATNINVIFKSTLLSLGIMLPLDFFFGSVRTHGRQTNTLSESALNVMTQTIHLRLTSP